MRFRPKNIILMIGDGMGPAHLTAYRQYKSFIHRDHSHNTLFDQYHIGSVASAPLGDMGKITDSAASATAYSTGTKVTNGALAIDDSGNKLKTLLQLAKEHHKSTGLVATSQLVHATPAAFAAHVEFREMFSDIADQFFDNHFQGRPYIDVLLGGGNNYFQRTDRDLVAEFSAIGYQLLRKKSDLDFADQTQLLGLFSAEGLPCVLDREHEDPSLADLTRTALNALSHNPNGFFLLVEGSQIDWASHNNDIHSAMHEIACFEAAFAEVIAYTEQHPDTLVITTADHETGGLTLGRRVDNLSVDHWQPAPLANLNMSPHKLASQLSHIHGTERLDYFYQHTSIDLDRDTAHELSHLSSELEITFWIRDFMNKVSHTDWTTGGHTGVDVHLYGLGCGINEFIGHHANHHIGQKMRMMMTSEQFTHPPLKAV